MCDKKKAYPGAGTPGQATGQGNFSGYSNPTNDSTTTPAKGQVTISDFLHAGRENALPLAVLCQLTGMDGRQVRLCIQRERLMGEPILSDNAHGYYLPGSEREVREFIRSMRHRAREIEKAAGVIEGVYYGR
ncbi:hypothetical protein D7X94_17465 [Acutalibacter sp. 1XD8-33]|uniref:hypothetical protein n=1 Tax=Acutalibacter sp. 1XD8-33 TaxID=2320081 RepID=UPI000EA323B0|nr:hypothetical protein [Acutalibacter sp. 1XD8-33]RKJ38163.1 hypothetical protein D7X94_17465 [Acutalibacter sp. 1XD8-33]